LEENKEYQQKKYEEIHEIPTALSQSTSTDSVLCEKCKISIKEELSKFSKYNVGTVYDSPII